MEKYLILHPSCFWVKGFLQSTVCDFQRNVVEFIPTDLYDFCKKYNKQKIDFIYSQHDEELHSVIDEYLEYLEINEFSFRGSFHDMKFIAPQSLKWDRHAIITNLVIELSEENIYKIKDELFIQKIMDIGVESIQVICYRNSNIFYEELLGVIPVLSEKTFLTSIEIILPCFEVEYFKEKLNSLIQIGGNILTRVIIPSCPNENTQNVNGVQLIYITQSLSNCNSCGIIDKSYFSLRLEHLNESQQHNTCLNRKLCIDEQGNIKNCPSMQKSFGNIKNTTLQEAIEKPGFKDLWFIYKDKIDVCKDCEYRHICSDCRCFIDNPENIYSRPAKCTYNPYIAKWANEEGYVPVSECGNYNKQTGFVPDMAKIAELNNQIWGE